MQPPIAAFSTLVYLTGETETFSFDNETEAWEKAIELQNEDSSGRRYKAVKL